MKTINFKVNYLIIILVTFLFSCNNNIEGVWFVEKIILDDKEMKLDVNLLIFEKEGECNVPQIYGEYIDTKANWEYLSKEHIRIFNCKKLNFNDTFTFSIESGNQKNLYLESRTSFIVSNR